MSFELRDYQVDCIETIKKVFEKEYAQLIQMPTGSGKTWIFLNYLKKYSPTGLIICPNRELQQQIYDWGKFFLGKEKISLGLKSKKKYPYYVVTAASLLFDDNVFFLIDQKFQTIIIDEAHHATSKTYTNFIHDYDDCWSEYDLLGCTATPERLDKKCLMEIFNYMSYDMNLVDMIDKGYLADIEGYRIKTDCKLGTRAVTKSGDFQAMELKKLDIESRNNILINIFEKECHDKKTLIFCLSVEHSFKIAQALKEKGYRAAAIAGMLNMPERRKILNDFKTGKIQVLTNCQLLTEGFDEPTIEALIIARPTKSKSLYCQMLGRGVRKVPGKEICYLYELTDNNHKICTFGHAANEELECDFEYMNGTRLSKLRRNMEGLTPEEILINKERFDIFPKNTNIFKSVLNCIPPTERQRDLLEKIDPDIKAIHPSMLEAAFFIWKQKQLVAYGVN